MSYDAYIEVDTGGPEPLTADIGNYTSNVSPIWSRCLTAVMGEVGNSRHFAGADDRHMIENYGPTAVGVDGVERERTVRTDQLCLRDLQGARCGDIVDLLKAAVEWGTENLGELREMNPENGWGDAEGALAYLGDIKWMCEAHPKAELRLSS